MVVKLKAASGVLAVILAGIVAGYAGWRIGSEPSIPEVKPVSVDDPRVSQQEWPLPRIEPVKKLEIDLNSRRVLIPDEGWFDAREFWKIYYREPQRLPGEIDFELLSKLEELTRDGKALAESGTTEQRDETSRMDDFDPNDPLALPPPQ